MDFVHGCERQGLENYFHECNIASTGKLLELLCEHHSKLVPEIPVIVIEPEPLPPIPNSEISAAASVAFPSFNTSKTIKNIQRAVAAEFAPVTVMDINSQRRTAPVVRARQVAMYLSKVMTARSLPEIGRRIGGRDHTTVLHGVRKIRDLIEVDPILSARISRIKAHLEATTYEANTDPSDCEPVKAISPASADSAPEGAALA